MRCIDTCVPLLGFCQSVRCDTWGVWITAVTVASPYRPIALISQHAVGQGAAYSSARPSGNWESSRRSAGHVLSFSLLPNASSHSLTVNANPRFFLSLYLIFCSYFPFCPFFFSSLSLSLYLSSSLERVSVYAQTHHHCTDSIT